MSTRTIQRAMPMHQSATDTILISGAGGLVGAALSEQLLNEGHAFRRLGRKASRRTDLSWDPGSGSLDPIPDNLSAVVHLAGESIADGRWTRRKMDRIRKSRVLGTRLLAESLARLPKPPPVLVCASAIGFYGEGGNQIQTEESARGAGFLADVCGEWEAASQAALEAGIRVVHLRIGVVLAPQGGALEKMLPPFRLGLGGRLGSGDQYMSWIHIEDLVHAICRSINDASLSGPVNACSPQPVTNEEFTKALGRVLGRPTALPVPGFMARLALGKMADELLLASMRVKPDRLLQSGFAFQHPNLEGALRDLLDRPQ